MKIFENNRIKARNVVAEGLPPLLARLWRFGYSLSRSADIADELLQETCVRALDKALQFAPGTRLDSWTFAILNSLWINHLRAEKVRAGTGVLPVEELDLASPGPDTEMNIFASQVVDHVMALPEAQRLTVFLVYVEGYSYRETSQILNIPVGTVMSRLATARHKLSYLNDEVIKGRAKGK